MIFIQTNTDEAYEQQLREADQRWEKQQQEEMEIREEERDRNLVEQIAERYRNGNKGKSPP